MIPLRPRSLPSPGDSLSLRLGRTEPRTRIASDSGGLEALSLSRAWESESGCWSYAPTNALGTAGRGTHWGLRAVSGPEALRGSEEVMRMSM